MKLNEKIRAVIVEDEPDNRENLKLLLEAYCEEIEVAAEAATVADGVREISKVQPDLVFLDVELPDGNGFDVLEKLHSKELQVIFITAFSEYAIRAIKFDALDYIMKPIDISELRSAVDKVLNKRQTMNSFSRIENLLANLHTREVQKRRIPLASADALKMVELQHIVRLEGESNYTRFYFTNDNPFLVARTLKEYEEILSDSEFMRVHQSHIVNLNFVKSYVKSDGGYLVMQDGTQVGVARNRKSGLLERLYA